MYCWSLAWRILNITLLACEMSAIGLVWAFLTKWYRDTGLYCSPLKSFHLGLHLINPKFWNLSPVLLTLGCLETALCIIQGLARFEQSLYTTWSSLIFPLWWLHYTLSLGSSSQSVQFSAVPQSCPTLCDPMNRSTPGLPVHHHLPEFTQTHVYWVRDAIQPSHPRSSPSSPAPNPSQHQSLFQWVNSSHEVAKVLEFQL